MEPTPPLVVSIVRVDGYAHLWTWYYQPSTSQRARTTQVNSSASKVHLFNPLPIDSPSTASSPLRQIVWTDNTHATPGSKSCADSLTYDDSLFRLYTMYYAGAPPAPQPDPPSGSGLYQIIHLKPYTDQSVSARTHIMFEGKLQSFLFHEKDSMADRELMISNAFSLPLQRLSFWADGARKSLHHSGFYELEGSFGNPVTATEQGTHWRFLMMRYNQEIMCRADVFVHVRESEQVRIELTSRGALYVLVTDSMPLAKAPHYPAVNEQDVFTKGDCQKSEYSKSSGYTRSTFLFEPWGGVHFSAYVDNKLRHEFHVTIMAVGLHITKPPVFRVHSRR